MTWSEEQYAAYLAGKGQNPPAKPMRRSKYGAVKTWLDGICFDSKKEAGYYASLKLLAKAGAIDGFLYHGKMVVTEGTGPEQRAAMYEPDFVVLYPDGRYEIVDTKGMETEVFRLKRKMLRERYPKIEIKVE